MMIFTKLQRSVHATKKLWLLSLVVSILALLAGNTAIADNSDSRVLSDTPTARITGGVYLYGESERPDVVGKEYIIFEMVGKKTVGAFYLPQSEFSCFYGQFNGSKLDVTLIDGYDQKKYNYALTLNERGLTASRLPHMGAPNYKPLAQIGENDRRMLNSCKVQLQK